MAPLTAFITGGTRGIGLAVAQALAKRGYTLVLSYAQDTQTAQQAAQMLREHGAPDVHLICDQGRDLSHAQQTAQQIRHHVDTLSVAIFNAGLTDRSAFESLTPQAWTDVFCVNVHYPVFLLQSLLPSMQPGGVVLFSGSMLGQYPHSMSLAYGISKSAVHALAANLVKHLEPYNIRVCAIAPGFVDTDWQRSKAPEIRSRIEGKIALHRFATVQEAASAYLFAIDNTYCNGVVLPLTGGYNYN